MTDLYKRLDMVKRRLDVDLEVGKTYVLGIAHLGYFFSHYEVCEILSKTVHSKYSISYGCKSKEGFGYYWDQPHWGSVGTRIVSAELLREQ